MCVSLLAFLCLYSHTLLNTSCQPQDWLYPVSCTTDWNSDMFQPHIWTTWLKFSTIIQTWKIKSTICEIRCHTFTIYLSLSISTGLFQYNKREVCVWESHGWAKHPLSSVNPLNSSCSCNVWYSIGWEHKGSFPVKGQVFYCTWYWTLPSFFPPRESGGHSQ